MYYIKFLLKYIINIYKKRKLKRNNIIIESNVSFNNTKFSIYNRICKNSQINNTSINSFSYIGWNCILNNIDIGSFCSIAPHVEIIYGRHPTEFISTHPLFYSTGKQCGISFLRKNLINEFKYVENTNKSVIIQNDVWIGYGVKIIEGVIISNGAVVLAGSVVTKNVEPYSIVGGIPAKHIKYRIDSIDKEKLLKIEWWNKDITWIKKNMDKFLNIEEFLKIKEKI